MRSIIFYAMTFSLCLATTLSAKPLPLREVPQREIPQREQPQRELPRIAERAPAPTHKKHPKQPKRVRPRVRECKACAAERPVIQVAVAPVPVPVLVAPQPPVQRVRAAPAPRAAMVHQNAWHSPQLVAPAPVVASPVYAIQQPVVAQAPAPAIVYERAPAAVMVECQPAARPYVALTPFMISGNLKYMTLSDRSEWRIRHRDRPRLRHWHSGDLIGIELGSYFSRFQYRLINHTRREAVEANRI